MSRRTPLQSLAQIFVLAFVSAAALHASVAHAADGDKPKPAWRTEKHILEVGGYLGALFPAADHGLYAENITKTQRPIKTGFDVGIRFAYLPLRFVGVEVEGGIVPTKLDGNGGYKTTLFAVRGHLILQMPTRLALFVVGGGGILGVTSSAKGLGSNVDGTLHVGGGLKYYLTEKVVLRIDGRDIASPNFSRGMAGGQDWAHNGEFTFGASFVIGRKSTKMLPRGG
jgi:OOP family OmpA-OmpF porin